MKLRTRCLILLLASSAAAQEPRLVLQITIDQLRGDLLPRYRERFGAEGFRKLLDHGVYYSNAHYATSNTFTASGHAVLATGADTAEHGMVANEWFDRESGKTVYCTNDPGRQNLGEPPKPGGGMSPVNLSSTTLGDELVVASGYQSRAFAVSGKDRSAVIPAGHLGKAFWYSDSTGGFATSTYYFPSLPDWLAAWNARREISRYRQMSWTPLRAISTYRYANPAGNPNARNAPSLGRIFPHPLVERSDSVFLAAFHFTPFLDEHTESFAEELMAGEKIGLNGKTDYLSISFSATDYIGHTWGPNSVEAEDNLIRLDLTLARLFSYVERTVGWDRTLVVLSADHGVDDIPEDRKSLGFAASRIYPKKMMEEGNQGLRSRFGITDDLIQAFVPPGFYLDGKKIAANRLTPEAVESALADELRHFPGVAYAYTRSDLLSGRIPQTEIGRKVQRGFHPTRSGDVVMVQAQFWYLYPDAEAFAAMHGSPYSYDTFVPIILSRAGMKAATSDAPVCPGDIAPTLARILGIKAPSGSVGNLLPMP